MSATAPTTTTTATAATAATATDATKGTAKPKVMKLCAPRAKVNKAIDPKSICEQFAGQVMERYQLDDAVMASMSEVVLAVLNNYHIYAEQQQAPVAAAADGAATTVVGKGKKAAVAAAGPKKPRKSSAYNIYVKEMMQDPKVKSVPQKEKMSIIGNLWKALPEAGRAPYKARADEVNATLGDDAVTETATEAAAGAV